MHVYGLHLVCIDFSSLIHSILCYCYNLNKFRDLSCFWVVCILKAEEQTRGAGRWKELRMSVCPQVLWGRQWVEGPCV